MKTGTRQAYLPGGRRTGAPGKHVVRGKAKYRLLDEKVRFFVAPPVEEINASPVRPDLSSSWPSVSHASLVSFDHMSTSTHGSQTNKSEKFLANSREEA
jgi:hypothetical protein